MNCVREEDDNVKLTLEDLVDLMNEQDDDSSSSDEEESEKENIIETLGGVLGIARALGVDIHHGLSYNPFDLKRRRDRFGVNKYSNKNKIDIMAGQLGWAWVWRSGSEVRVEPKDVVVGDILLLETDDMVCADGLLLPNDYPNSSSSHYERNEPEVAEEEDTPPIVMYEALTPPPAVSIKNEANPRIFSGTFVQAGKARMLVCLVGKHTRFGKIVHSSGAFVDKNQPLWMIPEKVRINEPQRYLSFIKFMDANPPRRAPPGSDFLERFYPSAHAILFLESFLGDLTVYKGWVGGKVFTFDQESWHATLGTEVLTHLSIGLSIATSIVGVYHRGKMLWEDEQEGALLDFVANTIGVDYKYVRTHPLVKLNLPTAGVKAALFMVDGIIQPTKEVVSESQPQQTQHSPQSSQEDAPSRPKHRKKKSVSYKDNNGGMKKREEDGQGQSLKHNRKGSKGVGDEHLDRKTEAGQHKSHKRRSSKEKAESLVSKKKEKDKDREKEREKEERESSIEDGGEGEEETSSDVKRKRGRTFSGGKSKEPVKQKTRKRGRSLEEGGSIVEKEEGKAGKANKKKHTRSSSMKEDNSPMKPKGKEDQGLKKKTKAEEEKPKEKKEKEKDKEKKKKKEKDKHKEKGKLKESGMQNVHNKEEQENERQEEIEGEKENTVSVQNIQEHVKALDEKDKLKMEQGIEEEERRKEKEKRKKEREAKELERIKEHEAETSEIIERAKEKEKLRENEREVAKQKDLEIKKEGEKAKQRAEDKKGKAKEKDKEKGKGKANIAEIEEQERENKRKEKGKEKIVQQQVGSDSSVDSEGGFEATAPFKKKQKKKAKNITVEVESTEKETREFDEPREKIHSGMIYCIGPPAVILPYCKYVLKKDGGVVEMSGAVKDHIMRQMDVHSNMDAVLIAYQPGATVKEKTVSMTTQKEEEPESDKNNRFKGGIAGNSTTQQKQHTVESDIQLTFVALLWMRHHFDKKYIAAFREWQSRGIKLKILTNKPADYAKFLLARAGILGDSFSFESDGSGIVDNDINQWCIKEKELDEDPQIFAKLKSSCLIFSATPTVACLKKVSQILKDKSEFTIVILSFESRMFCDTNHDESLFIAFGSLGNMFHGHSDVTISDRSVDSLTLVLQGFAASRNPDCIIQ